jgi:hypothetical protein
LLAAAAAWLLPSSYAGTQSYAQSNAGIKNIQVSSPPTGGAPDKTGACVSNAAYNNHRSESWVAVDPTDSSHLVGMSKFFFDPAFYLFHLGSYVSTDGGKSWSNEVDQQQFVGIVPIPSK